MKWLGKIFKGGPGRELTTEQHPQFLGEENMVWRVPPRSMDARSWAEREHEELQRAIALSLAEDLKRPNGAGQRPRSDERLAREIQDSLNIPSYPPYIPSYPPYTSITYYPRGNRICGGCNRDIGSGNYLGCMGTFFHPECFCCRRCGYPITEDEFSLSGRDPYHKACFKELSHPKCDVCHKFIPTNAAGLIEYRCHPFWFQKYCPSHEHDNTARCCSCERLEPWNVKYISLSDGRSLCMECMESAIMDTGDCQPLYHAIRDYYEWLNMKIDQQIPMLLVERQALNEAIVGEKNGYHHMPETRGLCLSEELTVRSVFSFVHLDLYSKFTEPYQILGGPRIGDHQPLVMRTFPQRLTRICDVAAILVLYGLPRLLTGAILAHELMHGWLRLKGFRNLNPEVEEGICQVLSYMWLRSEVIPNFRSMPSTSSGPPPPSSSTSKKGRISEVEKKLGEFFMHQIAEDTSAAYGGGFRAANAAVNKYGLQGTLARISQTGSFPL